IELSNPNHPVLRKLAIEAPGTYHHSLIVANLAESAAYDIGANPYLARAGGYYHDVGKIKYPLFFAENQGKENPHDSMSPMESCAVLISHVEFGLELAARYKLPKIIRDIIEQHQGTTKMKYFYHKACELAKESESAEVNEQDYRYSFTTPQTKESALIMLADTVEAAVRSRIPNVKAFTEIESLIRTLIKDKIDDGQLIDSGFTLRDIESTIQAFFKVFRAMNHERIAYPTATPKEADQ
ncbi:MAG: HDIG domain-containing protein, partial [Defluviitaleaceae bacterium]|nr:HDIG domain-containing protein [Defluviitaleaceae bacterium]